MQAAAVAATRSIVCEKIYRFEPNGLACLRHLARGLCYPNAYQIVHTAHTYSVHRIIYTFSLPCSVLSQCILYSMGDEDAGDDARRGRLYTAQHDSERASTVPLSTYLFIGHALVVNLFYLWWVIDCM